MNENAPHHRERLLDLKSQTVVAAPEPGSPPPASADTSSLAPAGTLPDRPAESVEAADSASALREAAEANRAAQEVASKE